MKFCGEGLKGTLQFVFIFVTILAALVTCSYKAHAIEVYSYFIPEAIYTTNGILDTDKADAVMDAVIKNFKKRSFCTGKAKIAIDEVEGGILISLMCFCKKQEVQNESNNLRKMQQKNRMHPTDTS